MSSLNTPERYVLKAIFLGNKTPPDDLSPWMPAQKYDLYAIGTQVTNHKPLTYHLNTNWLYRNASILQKLVETATLIGTILSPSKLSWLTRLYDF